MSAFSPERIDDAQLASLVSDPELAASAAAIIAAINALVTTRASQASVDNLGSTLGPAITTATADKATAAQLTAAKDAVIAAARIRPYQVLEFAAGHVPSDCTELQGQLTQLPTGCRMPALQLGVPLNTVAFASSGGILYAFTRSAVYKWDPATNTWPSILSTGLTAWGVDCGYAVTRADGKILFGGGTVTGTYSATAYLFNPATTTISAVLSSPVGMYGGVSSVLMADGSCVLFPGSTGTAGATTGGAVDNITWYVYGADGSWSSGTIVSTPFTTGLSAADKETAVCRLPSGKVMLVSNRQTQSASAVAYVLNLTTGAVTTLTIGLSVGSNGGQYQLVPTDSGALLYYAGSMRNYFESSDTWAAAPNPAFAATTVFGQGYTKGSACFITAQTYVLLVAASFSASANVNPVVIYNGFPQAATTKAYLNA